MADGAAGGQGAAPPAAPAAAPGGGGAGGSAAGGSAASGSDGSAAAGGGGSATAPPVKGVGTGAANLGDVTTTNDLLRTARASIGAYANVVGGNAGRDLTVHYHGSTAPEVLVQPIAAEVRDAVRAAFVPPAGFEEMAAAVLSCHVVVLRATPRHGGETAALRAAITPSRKWHAMA